MNIHAALRARANQLKQSTYQKTLIDSLSKTPFFPCNFISNLVNTNAGIRTPNASKVRDRFYQFEQLVTGNESIFLNWENSTKFEQNIDEEHWYNNYWKKSLQVGTTYYGYKYQETGNTQFGVSDFGTFGNFTDYSSQQIMRFQTTQRVSLTMLTQFFIILTEDNNYDSENFRWDESNIFYISDYQNYCDAYGNYSYSDITFISIRKEFQQSGQTVFQRIYFASPGESYAFPRLKQKQLKSNKYEIDLHPLFAVDRGIRSIQFEMTGNAMICGLEIYGYPVQKRGEFMDKVRAPRKLLVENFKLPIQENFLQISTANNTFYYTTLHLTATTEFENWRARRQQIVGDKIMDFQGIIETDKTITQNTNGGNTANDNGRALTINDNGLRVDEKFLEQFEALNVAVSHWFYDGQKPDDNSDGIGIKSITLTDYAGKTFKDLLNIMGFVTSFINQLPFEITYKVNWSLSDLWLIGGFLNKLVAGFPIAWRRIYENSSSYYPALQKLPALIAKPTYDFYSSTEFVSNTAGGDVKSMTSGKLPLDMFQKAESSTLGTIFGSESITTALHFSLTDKCIATSYKGHNEKNGTQIISTVLLDQLDPSKTDGSKFKVDTALEQRMALTKVGEFTDMRDGDDWNYVISGFGLRALGDGDIRIKMFQDDIDYLVAGDNGSSANPNNSVVYESIIKSSAGYRNGQVREWFTFNSMNFLEALTTWENPFPWPNLYPDPIPESNLPTWDWTVDAKGVIHSQHIDHQNREEIAYYHEEVMLDFAELGVINQDQIYSNYQMVTLNRSIFTFFVNAGTRTNPPDASDEWSTNVVQILMRDIPSEKNLNITAETGRVHANYGVATSTGDIRWGVYLDGLVLKIWTDINGYLEVVRETPPVINQCNLEIRLNGGNGQIVANLE